MFGLIRNEKHSMLFPVLLCFLPIIALNVWHFSVSEIDTQWKRQAQKNFAEQEAQTLTAASDFASQFKVHAAEFNKKFKDFSECIIPLGGSQASLKQQIKSSANVSFGPNFPDYDLYVFYLPEDPSKKGDLLLHKTVSKRPPPRFVLTQTFQYLVNVSEKKPLTAKDKSARKWLTEKVLNSPVDPQIIGESTKGKSIYSLYNNEPQRFIWNYFRIKGHGIYGYYLFCKNTEKYEHNGRLIAIEKFKANHKEAMCAYIPIFKGYGGLVCSDEKLTKSKLFSNFIEEITPKNEHELKIWSQHPVPNNIKLGKYTVYTNIGTGKGTTTTHLSAVFYPTIEQETKLPIWLYSVNLISSAIIILVLFKGMVLGIWPKISLRTRFTTSYMLASVLPISILMITVYSYIYQYRESGIFQAQAELQSSVNEFDRRKDQLINTYKTVYNEILIDKNLESILRTEGVNSIKAAQYVANCFYKHSPRLPLLSITFFDEGHEGVRMCFNPDGSYDIKPDASIEDLLYDVEPTLRDYKKDDGITDLKPNFLDLPENVDKQIRHDILLKSYESFAHNSLVDGLEGRRNSLFTIPYGDKLTYRIHDFIKVDGKFFCGLVIRWDDQALDDNTYNTTRVSLSLRNPQYAFVAFRNTEKGIEAYDNLRSNYDTALYNLAKKSAEMAASQKSSVTKRDGKYYTFATPSKSYQNVIFTGGGDTDEIISTTHSRILMFSIIIILTLLTVLSCNYITGKIILDPIGGLKSALDEVSAGHLNIEISGDSKDELGRLCHEFSMMTQGLREREKLATLISDQAMEAISSGTFDTESFKGVALVSDIRNFTGTCEAYSPNLVTQMLNTHFAEMTRIISEQGGRIYKYIGDAIEAVFPEDSRYTENASLRAFNAGSRMIVKLAHINRQRKKKNLFTYKIGIGLKYGDMHSGTVGSLDTRLDYAILGEPLKQAAVLESLSVQNPEFPLVTDDYTSHELEKLGFKFNKLDSETVSAYILEAFGNASSSSTNKEQKPTAYAERKKSEENKNQFKKIYANSGNNIFTPKLSYAAGLGFIFVLLITSFLGYTSTIQTQLKSFQTEANQIAIRIIEQIKSENTIQVAFENCCRNMLINLERELNNNAKEKVLADNMAKEIKDLQLSRALIVKFTPNDTGQIESTVLNNHGFSKKEAKNLIYLGLDNYHEIKKGKLERDYNVKEIMGETEFKRDFTRECRSKASKTKFSDKLGRSEYIFWDYVYSHTKIFKHENKLAVPLGIVFITQDSKKVENDINYIVKGFSNKYHNIYIALKNVKNNTWYHTKEYPQIICEKYDREKSIFNGSNEDIPNFGGNKNLLTRTDSITIQGNKYDILATIKTPEHLKGNVYLFSSSLIILGIILFYILHKIINETSFINKSITIKLWITLISISILPFVTVFFLFGLYIKENETTSIAQRRTELQAFSKDFERMANFTSPAAWKALEELSNSEAIDKEVIKLNAEYNTQKQNLKDNLEKPNLDFNSLDNTIREYLATVIRHGDAHHNVDITDYAQQLKKGKGIYPFYLQDIIVVTNKWDHIVKKDENIDEDRNTPEKIHGIELPKIIGMVGKKLGRLQSASNDQTANLSDSMQEEFVKTGLDILKSIFGVEAYLQFPHSIAIPTVITVTDTVIGMTIYSVPNIKNSKYMVMWIVLFNREFQDQSIRFNQYQRNLNIVDQNSKNSNLDPGIRVDSGFRIYATGLLPYGDIKTSENTSVNHEFKKISSFVANSNLPMASMLPTKNGPILYDARTCKEIAEGLVITTADLSHIKHHTDLLKKAFYAAMLISLTFVLLIAHNIASDILQPIKKIMIGMNKARKDEYSYRIRLGRTDELGVLCKSFDTMMKGLEEKRLMGKMISDTAQEVTLHSAGEESKKTDCVLLYVSVQNFNVIMNSMPASVLFNELKKQVSCIAGHVQSYGGEIDKIIGEKQLIVFHTGKRTIKESAEAACRAAIAIMRSESMGEMPFLASIGLSCGSVVTGFLGVGAKRDFTVIGDPVNVSARIATFAEKQRYDRCLVSEDIYELIKDDFHSKFLGEIPLKGKSKPMKVYHISK